MDGPVRFGAVALDCADPAALGAFWAGVLGGEVAFATEGFVAVSVAGTWLTAQRVEGYRPPAWPDGDPPKQIHLDLAVDDLEAGEAHVLALGATRAPHQPAPERFRVYLDPAGHPFCLTTLIP